MTSVDEGLFERLRAAVVQAGALVADGAARARVLAESADPSNPTTDLDRLVDAFLCERLLSAFDDAGAIAYMSEERADDPARFHARQVLVVDPIDGTRSLLKGLPEAAVSVALWRDGELVWGCVHNPFSGDVFTAWRGHGALRGGRPVRVSEERDPSRARLVVSVHEHEHGMLEPLRDRRPAVRPVGSIAWKMALVAAGEAEATLTAHVRHEWDVAAGTLLVTEAGGRVTDAAGSDLSFNRPDTSVKGLVVSNGLVHDEMLALVRRL